MYCLDWCMLPRCVAGYWLTDVGNIELEPLCVRLHIALGNSDGSYFHFRLASLLRPFRARCLPIFCSPLLLSACKRSVDTYCYEPQEPGDF
jgi:hypothetical protein